MTDSSKNPPLYGLRARIACPLPFETLRFHSLEISLAEELQRELHVDHPLYGISCRAIGRGKDPDGDDILYRVDNQLYPYVVVHLTWAKENTPDWPKFKMHFSRGQVRKHYAK